MKFSAILCASLIAVWALPVHAQTGEVDPDFGTRGLVGKAAVSLLNGADHDEENETEDRRSAEGEDCA